MIDFKLTFITVCASVGFDTVVSIFVFVQSLHSCELLATQITDKRSLPCVNPRMSPEIT